MKRLEYMLIIVITVLLLIGGAMLLPGWLQGSGTTIERLEAVESHRDEPEETPVTTVEASEPGSHVTEETVAEDIEIITETESDEEASTPENQGDAVTSDEDKPLVESGIQDNDSPMAATASLASEPVVTPIVETVMEPEVEEQADDLKEATEQTVTEKEVAVEAEVDTATWLDEQLAEYEGQIEEVDVETGVAIIEKLDIDYLNSLASEGLTEEEKEAVKAHMHSRLTEDEYATALALYREYIGLIQ